MMSKMSLISSTFLCLLPVPRDSQSSIAVIRAAISWFTSSIGRSRDSFSILIDSTFEGKGCSEGVGGAIASSGDSRSVEDPGEEMDLYDRDLESDGFGSCSPSVGFDWFGGGRGRRIEWKQPMLRVQLHWRVRIDVDDIDDIDGIDDNS